MQRKGFWDWALIGLLGLCIVLISLNLWLTFVLIDLDAQLQDADLKNYMCGTNYYEHTISGLEADLQAKNSLFINFCRRGYIPACGLGTN